MLFFGKKKKAKEIVSPLNGTICPLDQVPDDVFAQKMLGDGVAVVPTDGKICSPVSGTVSQVTETKHAYCVTSDDGLDILIHFGIDTVKLKGEGFNVLVKEGDRVEPGTPICEADIEFIKNAGYELHTPVLITNMDNISNIVVKSGTVKAGETIIMSYDLA